MGVLSTVVHGAKDEGPVEKYYRVNGSLPSNPLHLVPWCKKNGFPDLTWNFKASKDAIKAFNPTQNGTPPAAPASKKKRSTAKQGMSGREMIRRLNQGDSVDTITSHMSAMTTSSGRGRKSGMGAQVPKSGRRKKAPTSQSRAKGGFSPQQQGELLRKAWKAAMTLTKDTEGRANIMIRVLQGCGFPEDKIVEAAIGYLEGKTVDVRFLAANLKPEDYEFHMAFEAIMAMGENGRLGNLMPGDTAFHIEQLMGNHGAKGVKHINKGDKRVQKLNITWAKHPELLYAAHAWIFGMYADRATFRRAFDNAI